MLQFDILNLRYDCLHFVLGVREEELFRFGFLVEGSESENSH